MYRKGFWLILIENDDSETAVACQILSRTAAELRLRALIPSSWYPRTFTGFKVREDGVILGYRRLPPDAAIRIPAHDGLHSVDLELPLAAAGLPRAAGPSGQAMAAQGRVMM
jgi:hypothetical protein